MQTQPLEPVQWDDISELHEAGDGGGLLSSFKAIRQGSLSDLVGLVASLPEADRHRYTIVKSGDHRLDWAEITELAGRPDFPG